MKTFVLFFVSVALFGQVRYNRLEIIPSADDTQTGVLRFRELRANGVSAFQIAAPLTLTSNVFIRWPDSVGTAGQCLKTDGTENMVWQDCGASAPLFLTSDTYPQLQIQGATDTNKQLLVGYDVTANQSLLQSVHQGVSFTPITLQPYGGSVSVGLSGASGTQLNVIGDTWSRRLCSRGQIDYSAGFCFKFQNDTGVFSLTEQTTGNGVFETSLSGSSVRFYRNLLPLGAGTNTLGTSTDPWGTLWANEIRFASDLSGTIGTLTAKPANIHTGVATIYSSLLVRNGASATFQSGTTVTMDDADATTLDVSNLLRIGGQVGFLVDGSSNIGSPSVRASNVYANQLNTRSGFTSTLSGRVNFGGAIGAPSGADGFTGTISVRNAADTGSCTLTYSAGLLTGTTC